MWCPRANLEQPISPIMLKRTFFSPTAPETGTVSPPSSPFPFRYHVPDALSLEVRLQLPYRPNQNPYPRGRRRARNRWVELQPFFIIFKRPRLSLLRTRRAGPGPRSQDLVVPDSLATFFVSKWDACAAPLLIGPTLPTISARSIHAHLSLVGATHGLHMTRVCRPSSSRSS